MEDMPAHQDREQEEELLPSLASVYQLYDDDMLQQFVGAAGILLDEDVQLHRYDTIQLLIYLANSVKDPEDTREYYDLARAEYRMAQLYHQESAKEIRAVEELGVMLGQICAIVEAERAEAERAEAEWAAEAERAVEAEVMGEDAIKDCESLVNGADERDDREDTSNAMETDTVAVTLLVSTLFTSVPRFTH
jgi:hypothetical protein